MVFRESGNARNVRARKTAGMNDATAGNGEKLDLARKQRGKRAPLPRRKRITKNLYFLARKKPEKPKICHIKARKKPLYKKRLFPRSIWQIIPYQELPESYNFFSVSIHTRRQAYHRGHFYYSIFAGHVNPRQGETATAAPLPFSLYAYIRNTKTPSREHINDMRRAASISTIATGDGRGETRNVINHGRHTGDPRETPPRFPEKRIIMKRENGHPRRRPPPASI